MLPVRHRNSVLRPSYSDYYVSRRGVRVPMSKHAKQTARTELPLGKVKAILRGGTFHRIQVLIDPDASYVEHCGLNYTVTQQKDPSGRVICLWSRS